MANAILKEPAYKFLSVLLVDYLKKDPDRNLDKLRERASKYIENSSLAKMLISESDMSKILKTITVLDNDPKLRTYYNRVFRETNKKYLDVFFVNLLIRASLLGSVKRVDESHRLNVNIPSTILIDPTEACNLRCKGCWAGMYDINVMPAQRFDRILNEARELGIKFIALSGGEPMAYPHLFDVISKHKDMAFMMYTNGTLIDEKMAEKFLQTGNLTPAISLEGWEKETDERRGNGVYQKIMNSMDLLKKSGIPFGYSVTTTSQNCEILFSDEFVQFMINKGAIYGWSFHYIPIGRQPEFSAMVTPEQRRWLAERVKEIRSQYPLMLFDFWNDGELTRGCIAGGREYFHITANGNVEPCAFAHFKCDNINEKSLIDVLDNRVFKAYQKHQPISENFLRPCPIIDKPEILREIIKESGAEPSHEGANEILSGEAADFLDHLSAQWQEKSESVSKARPEK